MKLTRRKFFAGLAIAPLVPLGVALAAKLSVAKEVTLAEWFGSRWRHVTLPKTANWRKIHDGYKCQGSIETSLPSEVWRKLYGGLAEENEIYTGLLGYLEDTEEIT